MLDRILEQLNQSSTWRGLIAIITALGIVISPELQNAIIALGLAVIGTINVVRRS